MKINDCRIKPKETIEVGDLVQYIDLDGSEYTGLVVRNIYAEDGYNYYIVDVVDMTVVEVLKCIEDLEYVNVKLIEKANKLELKINN